MQLQHPTRARDGVDVCGMARPFICCASKQNAAQVWKLRCPTAMIGALVGPAVAPMNK